MPTLVIVTPPVPIVSIEEARRQLRVEFADDDETIRDLMRRTSASIEPPDSDIGRAFGVQTLELRLDETSWFPHYWSGDGWGCWRNCAEAITLRCPPVRSITSVKYDDTDGVEQTLDPSVYRVSGLGGTGPVRISLAYSQSWPALRCGQEAIRIRYTAGYDLDDPQLLPAKQAVLKMISDSYAFRETAFVGSGVAVAIPTSATVDDLLNRYRVWL